MKRNIIIYQGQSQQISPEHVSIDNIDNIVNYSVDNIFCNCLESLPHNLISPVIQKILHKIRPDGYIHVKILDIKEICLQLLQNKIHLTEYINLVKNKNSIITTDVIVSNIDFSKFMVTKFGNDQQHHTDLIIKRVNL